MINDLTIMDYLDEFIEFMDSLDIILADRLTWSQVSIIAVLIAWLFLAVYWVVFVITFPPGGR